MSFRGPNRTKGVSVAFDTLSTTNVLLPPPPLPGFVWDTVTSVTVIDNGVMSEHPVEGGEFPLTDHLRTNPTEVSITGRVSDTPITTAFSFTNIVQGIDPQLVSDDAAINKYELLKQIRAERRRLIVVASWFTLPSCWCTNITAVRGQADGASIMITATFKQIRVAIPRLVPTVIDADIQAAGFTAGGSSTGQSVDIGEWTGNAFSDL